MLSATFHMRHQCLKSSCAKIAATERQNMLGESFPPLKVLITDPERLLVLVRVTLGDEASPTPVPATIGETDST